MNIDFKNNDYRFNLRASAIIFNKDESKVLLFNVSGRDFYMLPGGRVEEYENSLSTIKREIKEELGWDNIDYSYVGLSEEFLKTSNSRNHQICIIYKGIYLSDINDNLFKGKEGDWINFKWQSINELESIKLYPDGIKDYILNKSTNTHFITNIMEDDY